MAFESAAANLVPGDTNASADVFVRDRASGATERASVDSAGAQAIGYSLNPAVSGDGRLVSFETPAALVGGDTNGQWDVLVRDRRTASTSRESVDSAGGEVAGFSLGAGPLVSASTISADGAVVGFVSRAGGFVEGDTNGYADVFVHAFHSATPGPPEVTGLAPGEGSIYGGTPVVLTGAHFLGTREVRFGDVPAMYFVVDVDDRLTAWSPEHPPATVDVTVINHDGVSAATPAARFTFRAPPVVSSVSPGEGPTAGGASVVIAGSGFAGATAVRFAGTAAPSFNVDADTRITALSPPGAAGVVDVVVETPWALSWPDPAARYTYRAPPVVSGLTPTEGPTAGGITVVIAGSGLTGATSVRFGDAPAVSFVVGSDARITAVSPPQGAGTAAVTVAAPGGTSGPVAFTYVAPPVVSGIGPTRGSTSGGTAVVIAGSGFTRATSVRFGDAPAASFVVDSDTRLTAVSPPQAKGSVHVRVSSVGGTSGASDADVFTFFGK